MGELHGLAVSLFLPRATSDDSPFRFLVIDDPVQAMDPTRVHRLALLLADEAKRRQVIVFTHPVAQRHDPAGTAGGGMLALLSSAPHHLWAVTRASTLESRVR